MTPSQSNISAWSAPAAAAETEKNFLLLVVVGGGGGEKEEKEEEEDPPPPPAPENVVRRVKRELRAEQDREGLGGERSMVNDEDEEQEDTIAL